MTLRLHLIHLSHLISAKRIGQRDCDVCMHCQCDCDVIGCVCACVCVCTVMTLSGKKKVSCPVSIGLPLTTKPLSYITHHSLIHSPTAQWVSVGRVQRVSVGSFSSSVGIQ